MQTGPYLTITGNSSIGARRADVPGGDLLAPADQRNINDPVNKAAFPVAPNDRFAAAYPPRNLQMQVMLTF